MSLVVELGTFRMKEMKLEPQTLFITASILTSVMQILLNLALQLLKKKLQNYLAPQVKN